MASEEFLNRKIKSLFKRFDLDNSGTIESKDFNAWSDKLIALGNLNAEQSQNLRDSIKKIWDTFFQPADVNNDGTISCDELVQYIKKELGNEAKREVILNALPSIFDSIDTDKDQSVSKVEFGNYFRSLNISDETVIETVFKAMDVNSDGTLNKSEFTAFGKDFFFGHDEASASKLFFGPLE